MFQSTFPRGERRQDSGSSTGVENVSIHVPTRGTTFVICVFFVDVVVSIHVPTRGTTKKSHISEMITVFQSTFPRGERRRWAGHRNRKKRFNPRSHEGNDKLQFISTVSLGSFNPRSHEGNDAGYTILNTPGNSFNPRSHEGNDRSPDDPPTSLRGFNPRSHEGNDSTSSVSL